MSWRSLSNSLLLLLPLHSSRLKKFAWGLPGCPGIKALRPVQGIWVQPLMETKPLYMLSGAAIKKKKLLDFCFVYGLNPLLF